jgi:hypothetical protein
MFLITFANPVRAMWPNGMAFQARLREETPSEEGDVSPDYPDASIEVGRDRLIRVFRFLEALSHHRSPVKRLLSNYSWSMRLSDLPDHPAIKINLAFPSGSRSDPEPPAPTNGESVEAVILRVNRPKRTQPPPPPEPIADWIEPGWEDPNGVVRARQSRNERDAQELTAVNRFDEDPRRPEALNLWLSQREMWATRERPARDAEQVYERLYALQGHLDREGGRLELVLGDGLLIWRPPDGMEVRHPVLLQRVQLDFDPKAPAFSVTDTGQGIELNTVLLQSLPGIDGGAVGRWNEELTQIDPQAIEDCASFLSALATRLSSRGEFIKEPPVGPAGPEPRIGLDPVLFLRERATGLTPALAQTAEDMHARKDLPAHLLSIVGVHRGSDSSERATTDDLAPADSGGGDDDILFSKPANAEQRDIVRRLDRHGAVVVQGPPGTGKSHTIANLIGHLLAQGKSVLVTSHTTKALRVLRGHIAEPLQPLCVSVLEGDLEGRRELEESVRAILKHLADDTAALGREATELAAQRQGLLHERERVRDELMLALSDEYRDITVAGEGYSPWVAARRVADGRGHDWIPPGLSAGDPLPLPPAELADLYRTVKAITAEDEDEARCWLPKPSALPSPDDFDRFVDGRTKLAVLDRASGSRFWVASPGVWRRLRKLSLRIGEATAILDLRAPWRLEAIDAGRLGGPHREPWDDLLAMIANAVRLAADAKFHLMKHDPRPPTAPVLADQKRIASEILRHVEGGGKLGRFVLLIRRTWKTWIERASVGGQRPHLPEHFRALEVVIDLTLCRNALIARWDRQMVAFGAPRLNPDKPEATADQFTRLIRDCLGWYDREWRPIEAELSEVGFQWEAFLAESPPNLANHGNILRIVEAARDRLPRTLNAWANADRWQFTDSYLAQLARALSPSDGERPARVVGGLRQSVAANDPVTFHEHHCRLIELHNLRADLDRRDQQLARLGRVAPAWATAIRHRHKPHDDGVVPGDAQEAWLLRQLSEELDRRNRKSLQNIQRETQRIDEELRQVTVKLIERRAWGFQVRRVTPDKRQSLTGWHNTVGKIGKGTGILVPKLRAQAARLMAECRGAVPVWIMPLSRVVENFDPRSTRFDVLIIDEASQSDAFSLLALSMAREVVVVGDHEQVSPHAVGQNLATVKNLIDTHLKDIPNAHLYDGQRSIYDVAWEAFGGLIRLKEHFRCVREIITFSNNLSYHGEIKPLRDETRVPLRPHVVAYRVREAAPVQGKVNRVEAAEVTALLVAATEEPTYAGKTFGVISLLGDDQAVEIERILRTRMRPEAYRDRRLLCGSAAQFQGDERDIVFLSLVHVASDGPLRLLDDDHAKRRFNVAASRARDQMWVQGQRALL